MRKIKAVLRLKLYTGLSHQQITAALAFQSQASWLGRRPRPGLGVGASC